MIIAGKIYQLISTADSIVLIAGDEYGEPIRKA
jgi:hypothetical protein